jgi:hypothetical protein
MRSKPSQHVFSIIDLAKWAPRITKYEFVKRIPSASHPRRTKVGVSY